MEAFSEDLLNAFEEILQRYRDDTHSAFDRPVINGERSAQLGIDERIAGMLATNEDGEVVEEQEEGDAAEEIQIVLWESEMERNEQLAFDELIARMLAEDEDEEEEDAAEEIQTRPMESASFTERNDQLENDRLVARMPPNSDLGQPQAENRSRPTSGHEQQYQCPICYESVILQSTPDDQQSTTHQATSNNDDTTSDADPSPSIFCPSCIQIYHRNPCLHSWVQAASGSHAATCPCCRIEFEDDFVRDLLDEDSDGEDRGRPPSSIGSNIIRVGSSSSSNASSSDGRDRRL